MLEHPPRHSGADVHSVKQKTTLLKLHLGMGIDLRADWEEEIKEMIRGMYEQDQSYG